MLSVAAILYTYEGEYIRDASYIVAPRDGVVNSPEAMRVNGITPELQKREGFPIGAILEELGWAINAAGLVVAHNAVFDRPVIEAEFLRANLDVPKCNWFCTKEDIGNLLQLPPTERQKMYRPDIKYKQPSLAELYEYCFGTKDIPGREQFHGSKVDAEACAACYWKLKHAMKI
jgi:DNA polymerase III epsilon subunit-like protein